MLLISNTYWLGMPFNHKGDLPEGCTQHPVLLRTEDFRDCSGIFYEPESISRQTIGVLVMHPRADFSRHYCIPPFVEAGIACLGLGTRCLNNDITAIHEELIIDVAAGVKYLKETQGCDNVLLFGNSGGGSLFSFYQAQAQKPQGQRIDTTPAGDKTKLNQVEMIPADGYLAISSHKGEGLILQECIDPSVTDESNPSLTNPTLDMYNVDNGFAEPPSPSSYTPKFVSSYRSAQHARVAKLDGMARAMIDEARHNEMLYKGSEGKLGFTDRQRIGRLGATERVMVINRTMANLNYTDPSLDPSDRDYGSLFSNRPDLMNWQYIGFGRIVRPEAWLSTWSGISSNANMLTNLAGLQVPVLMVNVTRDKEIYPKADAEVMWDAVKVEDRTFLKINAEHYFEPEFGAKTAPDVHKLMKEVVPWVLERFGQ